MFIHFYIVLTLRKTCMGNYILACSCFLACAAAACSLLPACSSPFLQCLRPVCCSPDARPLPHVLVVKCVGQRVNHASTASHHFISSSCDGLLSVVQFLMLGTAVSQSPRGLKHGQPSMPSHGEPPKKWGYMVLLQPGAAANLCLGFKGLGCCATFQKYLARLHTC